MATEPCLRCGVDILEHPIPTWHYEKRVVDGKTVMAPVLDGHLFLNQPDGDEDDDD